MTKKEFPACGGSRQKLGNQPAAGRLKGILVCGSVAYDYIMSFNGYFDKTILPEDIQHLSISFLADNHERYFGGCAPNVAYNLKLLGETPYIVGVYGNDFEEYKKWLTSNDISVKYIDVAENSLTSAAYILNDKNQNQITIFAPSAMKNLRKAVSLSKVNIDEIACGIISADMPDRMFALSRECKKHNVPYLFDPGQAMSSLSKEQLLEITNGSIGVIANEYETSMITNLLGRSVPELLNEIGFFIETLGGDGAKIYTKRPKGLPANSVSEANSKGTADGLVVPAIPGLKVVDATGCGDAFRSGFLHGYIQKSPIKRCCELANTAASFVVGGVGTQNHHFTQEEFSDRLKKYYGE
ncbi:carbohydrate kinase family protein [Candidatus Peregrinibacteria bacterium]|nr:carbohydrate kinase family protein [Candidatus Peregrinibacteria bacterium]